MARSLSDLAYAPTKATESGRERFRPWIVESRLLTGKFPSILDRKSVKRMGSGTKRGREDHSGS